MSTQLTNAGIQGPIPEDFNFDAHLAIPDALTVSEIPLATRFKRNVEIETGLKDIGLLCVGCTPIAMNEFQELVNSEAVCTSLAPLPVAHVRFIAAEHQRTRKIAEVTGK